ADAVLQRDFLRDGQRVELFIAYFAGRGPGKKLVGGDTRFDDDMRWRRISGAPTPTDIADSGIRPVGERQAGPGRTRMIWYVYWIDGQFVTSGVRAKLLQAVAELKGGGRGSAVIALCTEEVDEQ